MQTEAPGTEHHADLSIKYKPTTHSYPSYETITRHASHGNIRNRPRKSAIMYGNSLRQRNFLGTDPPAGPNKEKWNINPIHPPPPQKDLPATNQAQSHNIHRKGNHMKLRIDKKKPGS